MLEMDRRKELLVRMYLVLLAFVVLSIVIIARVLKVSVVEGDKWRAKGDKNIQLRPVYAERGNIYSEEYNLLATSLKFFDIHMDVTRASDEIFREEVDSLAYYLHKTVRRDKSIAQWKKDLKNARYEKKQYFRIAKGLSVESATLVEQMPILRYGRMKGGLIVTSYGRRVKPFKSMASRTIGEDRKNAEKVGLEGYFDKYLTGETQKVLMKKIRAKENVWVPIYDMSEMEQKAGNDIVTTINVRMQDVVHHELLKRTIKLKAKASVAILMEVETGAIKAISNFRMQKDSSYAEVYNDAVGRLSDPGSTFKLATVLSLLDDGYCDLGSKVDLEGGKARFYDRMMYDSDMHGYGVVTLKKAFEISSNVGISKLAHQFYNNKSGKAQFVDNLYQFGLTEKTGIEIHGESKPNIRNAKTSKWSGVTIPWMAHGYSLGLTPMQILGLYNAVANDGKYMKPYLVTDILDENEVIKHFDPRVLRESIANESSVKAAQTLLESVVQNGTGKKLKSDIVSIAGKTGTSVVNYKDKQSKKQYNASFAGYFPVDDPKYSMIVVMYQPGGNVYYGASAAGPAYKKIAEKISATTLNENYDSQLIASSDLPGANAGFREDFTNVFDYVGVTYKNAAKGRWVKVDPYELKMKIDKKKISTSVVPDVRGMGARDAIYVLENLGLKVTMDGVGKVAKQTIKPGTKIKGQDITIYMN